VCVCVCTKLKKIENKIIHLYMTVLYHEHLIFDLRPNNTNFCVHLATLFILISNEISVSFL